MNVLRKVSEITKLDVKNNSKYEVTTFIILDYIAFNAEALEMVPFSGVYLDFSAKVQFFRKFWIVIL